MRLFAISIYTFCCSIASANELNPTHCKSNELVLLNARMYYEVERFYSGIEANTGKTLSLCADKLTEPLGKLVYRYGRIGSVEMEKVATYSDKFGLSRQSDPDSHAGLISISFTNMEYSFEISEGMGMANGITLYVDRSGKRILSLISDNNFESNMININFEKASSPIFKVVEPMHPW